MEKCWELKLNFKQILWTHSHTLGSLVFETQNKEMKENVELTLPKESQQGNDNNIIQHIGELWLEGVMEDFG